MNIDAWRMRPIPLMNSLQALVAETPRRVGPAEIELGTPAFESGKKSLPPLSSIISRLESQQEEQGHNGSAKKRLPLPSIDTLIASNVGAKTSQVNLWEGYSVAQNSPGQQTPSKVNSLYSEPSMSAGVKVKKENKRSSKKSPTKDSKAYAFISHSPVTFPSQEPSIDNAPLARRKRRRTSPTELNILNNEYKLGTTPNKARRLEIAAKVSMSEKAVQIWFQNKRQSLRKQSTVEKGANEVTETPKMLSMSTPIKPPLAKFESQPQMRFPSPASAGRPSSTSAAGCSGGPSNLQSQLTPSMEKSISSPDINSSFTAYDESSISVSTSNKRAHDSVKEENCGPTNTEDKTGITFNIPSFKYPVPESSAASALKKMNQVLKEEQSNETEKENLLPEGAKAVSVKKERNNSERLPLKMVATSCMNRNKKQTFKRNDDDCAQHLLSLKEGTWN